MMSTPERAIAEHIANCSFDAIPESAVAAAKRSIIDGVASMTAGKSADGMSALLLLTQQWGGTEEARIFGSKKKVPAPVAASANAAQMRALEIDDTTDIIPIHPGVATLPALLAASELRTISGREFLRALIIAQDLNVRFALSLRKNPMQSGRSDLYRTFSGSAAVAAAMKFDAPSVLNAMGLSASFASSDLQGVLEGTNAFWVQCGNSASGALQSCILADLGVTGPQNFLFGRAGYYKALEVDHDLEPLLEGLGEHFENVRIVTKPYASCRGNHAIIDMACAYRDAHGEAQVKQIERIEVTLTPEMHNLVSLPRDQKAAPASSTDAQFSAYFSVASALLRGGMGLADVRPDALRDPEILKLAQKINTSPDPGHRTSEIIGRSTLAIHTSDGKTTSTTSDAPLGGARNPITAEALRRKLIECIDHAERRIPERTVDQFIEQVQNIEKSPVACAVFDAFA
jgi:2-methylcitrate dehydratase PrpD